MNKPREKVLAICPKCRKVHEYVPIINYRSVKWTGNGIPRIICSECRHLILSVQINAQKSYEVRHRQTTMFGICESRGLSPKQKQKYDLDLEIMARKFRNKEKRLYQ